MHKITIAMAVAASTIASAAELQVPAQYTTIQAAVDAATHGDVVVVARGTYHETLDLGAKELTLRGPAGAAETILDGTGGTASILTARNVEPRRVVVQGFTFRNGQGALPRACGLEVRKGGAILAVGTRLTVTDCVFEENGDEAFDVEYGGAIFSCETDLRIERSRFARNRAVHGGAIVIASVGARDSSITGSTFEGNRGDNDSGAILAKLNSFAALTVRDCAFEENDSGHGGGVMLEMAGRSRAVVERVRFSRNRASGTGGGMDVLTGETASIAVSGCTFESHRAAHGAGLQLVTEGASTASVTACTFTGGTASFGGGANVVSTASSRIEMTDCHFAGNEASFGGGLVAAALDGNIRISGSRFLDNVARFRPEIGIYRDLCFVDGLPPQGNGLYFGGGAELRTQEGGSITLSSSLFAGNSGMRGGGVHASTCAGGTIDLVNDTIADNDGSGVHLRFGRSREPQYTNLGTIRVANAIVRGNAAEEIVTERFDTRSDAEVSYSNVEGGFAGAGNFDLPPSFVDAAARNYRLTAGSSCIDAGDNDALVDDADVARKPRLSGRGPAPVVDVGAYEYQWSSPRRRAVR